MENFNSFYYIMMPFLMVVHGLSQERSDQACRVLHGAINTGQFDQFCNMPNPEQLLMWLHEHGYVKNHNLAYNIV